MSKIYKVDYNPKLLQTLCYFGFLIPLLVIMVDVPLLPKNLQPYYIVGRLLTSAISLTIIMQIKLGKPRAWHLPIFFLTIVGYSIHGQLFLPCYYLAYMESIILLGLFFTAPKKIFYCVMIPSILGMSAAVLFSKASYGFQTAEMATKFKFDALCGVIITSWVSCIGYKHIATTRKQKDILSEKFLDLGCQISILVHDFKNLLQGPIATIWFLKRANRDEEKSQLIDRLEDDLKFLHSYVLETNALSCTSEPQEFRLSEINKSLGIILRKQLTGRQLIFQEDCSVVAEKSVLLKVFYNLIMNSIQANATEIEIGCDKPNRFYVKDNGPGFPKNYLKAINSGKCVYANDGKSIGIYLINHMMEARGHRLCFSNQTSGGALVRIIL